MDLTETLQFTPTHEWIRVNEASITIGITDYQQHHLSDIFSVELPEPDDHHFKAGEEIGVIESADDSVAFHAPVGGTVIRVNTTLLSSPELINEDPYEKGWLIEMKPDDMHELDDLIDYFEYEELLPEEDDSEL